MSFVPFVMERWQSLHEHRVDLNLSESGVHPLTVAETLQLAEVRAEDLGQVPLEYIQSNGSDALRGRIASLYPDAGVANVVATSGSAEANFVTAWHLADGADHFVFQEPNYLQVCGVAENLGVPVKSWWLDPTDWSADLAALTELVNERTRAIFLTNPHNPTAQCFDADFLDAVVEVAARHGTWVVADEVYRGAEFDGVETPTLWGRYERVVVASGLSKAYGVPGLRLGWLLAPAELAAELWGRKDYTTISPAAMSDWLATAILRDGIRERFLDRTREIVRSNWELLERWLRERERLFEWVAPRAGAIAFPAFRTEVDIEALAETLRAEHSALIVPGTHFGLPRHLRLGIGPRPEQLTEGLRRLAAALEAMPIVHKPEPPG